LRKKIFGLLLVGLLALVLFACDSKEDQIKKALDLIGVPSGVIEDFELELASGDVTFEWSSNNSALKIGTASGGKVTVEVTRPANDVSVELTVKGTLGKVSLDKKFTVLVMVLQDQLLTLLKKK
jgi:hypothetical protein